MSVTGIRWKLLGLSGALALALSACGGGGSGGGDNMAGGGSGETTGPASPEPTAEGAYAGSFTTGADSGVFNLIVLEDDEYWALYGVEAGNTFYVAGFQQGQGISSNGKFTSGNVRDFGVFPVPQGTLEASYNGQSINGASAFPQWSSSFSAASIPASTYDYEAPASIASLTGSWSMTMLDGSLAAVTIDGNGSFSGSNLGCQFTGSMTPRPSGKNLFDVDVNFGSTPCVLANQQASGIAVSYLIEGTSVRQLLVAGTNAARTHGTALFGTR